MKSRDLKLLATLVVLAFLSTINNQLSTAFAQGTAFTYQGQLQNGGALTSGTYNLTFALFTNNAGGTAIAGPVTNSGVGISNGLFTVIIDFGAGPWNGVSNWLEIAVETNGAGSFTTLAPRQEVTPTPYAIFANTASNLSGTLPTTQLNGTIIDTQLLHDAVTVNSGPGLIGGGRVLLGNTITLTNTGVLSVTGNADITATTAGGAVTLGDTATNTDTPNTIVKRDGSGSFSADNVTLDGVLNLPAAGSIATEINAGGNTLINADTNSDFFAGLNAGPGLSGNNNTGVGANALNDSIGSLNTAVGSRTLFSNNGGANNTAVGASALLNNSSGSYNTATGAGALEQNVSASGNTADGYVALELNTSGSANTAVGSGAMLNNTIGSYNSALGNNALLNNTLGSNNTANGYQALYNNTFGTANTANGDEALYSNTGDTNGFGSANTATGSFALRENQLGIYDTATGYGALNADVGDNAGNGDYNTADGALALEGNTTGSDNTGTGYGALQSNEGGNENTAVGVTAVGYNNNANNETGVGYAACANTVGGGNTAVGCFAFNCFADVGNAMNNNTALGANTLFHVVKGDNNTALGWNALNALTNGDINIAVGYRAGQNIMQGSNNIEIGNQGGASDNDTIKIGTEGTQTTTYIAGISGATAASGVEVFVNSSGQLGTLTSSARFKQNIQDMGDASDVLLSLRPVTFQYKPEIDPQGTSQFGLVAEDVARVDPDLVARDDKGKIYTVRYQAVSAMLLNEFLKEHRTVEEQHTAIQGLKEKLEGRSQQEENQIGELTQENVELKARLEKLEQLIASMRGSK